MTNRSMVKQVARGLGAGVAGVLVSGVVVAPAAQATVNSGLLPGGTAFSTDIQSPGSGQHLPEWQSVVLVGSSIVAAGGSTALLEYTLDGGPRTAVPAAELSPSLPAAGPVEVRTGVRLGVLEPGLHYACLIGTGSDGGGAKELGDCHTFTVSRAPQLVALPPVGSGVEGASINLPDPVVFDPDFDETLSYAWTYAPRPGVVAPHPTAACSFAPSAFVAEPTLTCTDNGSYDVTVSVSDGANPPVQSATALTVQNRVPSVRLTSADSVHLRPGGSVDVASTFTDLGSNDSHTCTIDWGDLSSLVVRPTTDGTCGETGHVYYQPGLRNLSVRVTDDDGGTGTVTVPVRVDAAPTSDAGQAVSGPEGSLIALDGTVTDDNNSAQRTLWDLPSGVSMDAGAGCAFAAANMVDTGVRCTDDGTFSARLTATDGLGNAVDNTAVTVTNVAPDLVLTAPSDGGEYPTPSVVTTTGAFTDPGTNDTHTCSVDWAGTTVPGAIAAGTCTGTRVLATPGLHTIAMTVRDDDAGTDTESLQITLNAPPTVDAGSGASGAEGSPIALAGSVNDPDDIVVPTWTYQVDSGDPGTSCTFGDIHSVATTLRCSDDATVTATLSVNDGVNATVSDTTSVTVRNAAPAGSLTAPATGGLYKLGSPVAVNASVTDAGTNDTLTCGITWDDGSATSGLAVTAGACAAVHTFAVPGVYTLALTVTDDDGASATTSAFVVVYDPSAGFVTGGGTLASPSGAYRPNTTLSGLATFGFVSKYQKGATAPIGQTEFLFRAAGFSFNSTAYQWLVVAGSKAQYKGIGTVNDSPGYSFLLTAYDGGKTAVDRLRMKVWQTATGRVIYDNNVAGAGDDIDAADPQAISGGSIVIQR